MAKIVLALGGNALGNTPYEQLELVRETAKPIVDLIAEGNQVVIAHGNGPQVGMINLGMATAAESKAIKSDMPFPECGAMSQGYIGYHLQNAIGNELQFRGINKNVVTLVTQVLVDENDPAFKKPTKPVGAFYDKETAERISKEKGYTMVEDAGRGFRRVVPSPKPIDVIEKETVKALINSGTVVITVGGGGIPVVKKDNKLYGTPAVIDKDYASEKLAELVDADLLLILTAVEKVAINYKKENESRKTYKYRLKMSKIGVLKYISHLDFLKLMIKAIKKSGIDVAYSLGFNPAPKLSLGVALPLFVSSVGEVMDIELYENISCEDLIVKLNNSLHENCRILKAKRMPDKHETVEMEARWATYEAVLQNKDLKKNQIEDIIKGVLAKESIFVERTNKKGLKKQVDIRKSIESIETEYNDDSLKIRFVLKATNSNSADENIPILRADDFISVAFPDSDWDICRLDLLNDLKQSLME